MTRPVVMVRVFGALILTVSLFFAAPIQSIPLSTIPGLGGLGTVGPPSPELLPETGIVGNISIANIIPVCYIAPNITPSNDNTTVVVTSFLGRVTIVPVSWFIMHGCEKKGSFQASLDPGIYSLTLSYCVGKQSGPYQPAGCPQAACGLQSCNLPITVDVLPGRLTPVRTGITTGIY